MIPIHTIDQKEALVSYAFLALIILSLLYMSVRIGLAYVLGYGQAYGLGICIGFFYNKFV